ncbi:hypothetical protein ACFFMM_01400 [Micromonospora chaiyaphumensis]|uniref:hypothetical protein n=1 Tax=Micromonospora chaiyaphumensis TaxID=307119 RepID=UPI000B8850C3|nr:hypothetical protein [Micromonospora chaiyaphumensis]
MHSHRRFENPPALPHEGVAEKLERALRDRSHEGEAASVLVGIALNDDDQAFVEYWCVEVGTRAVAGSPLLGLAGLCLGHTARRFGHLSDEALALAESLAMRAAADSSDVDGRALDGLDDIRSFLRRRPVDP